MDPILSNHAGDQKFASQEADSWKDIAMPIRIQHGDAQRSFTSTQQS